MVCSSVIQSFLAKPDSAPLASITNGFFLVILRTRTGELDKLKFIGRLLNAVNREYYYRRAYVGIRSGTDSVVGENHSVCNIFTDSEINSEVHNNNECAPFSCTYIS